MPENSNLPVIPVRIGGKVVNVVVCWSPEKVQEVLSHWPGGVVDGESKLTRGRPDERMWLVNKAKKLAGVL